MAGSSPGQLLIPKKEEELDIAPTIRARRVSSMGERGVVRAPSQPATAARSSGLQQKSIVAARGQGLADPSSYL
jgi:hypothetical protein